MKCVIKQSFLVFSVLASITPLHAATLSNNTSFPEYGRVLFSGTATNATFGSVGGDVMQPVLGDNNGFLYSDVMGDYGTDDTYLASPGLGYRRVFNNQIVGVSAFADYEKTSLDENFWVLSPGIELISPHWDAHVNGYFPTSLSKQNGSPVFASTLGDNSGIQFETGTHNQYDELIAPYVAIGNGGDAEIGYSFAGPHDYRDRIYAGTYYYQPSGDINNVQNILGITAGFEQPVSKNLKLSVFNSYDQVSNYTVGVGLSVTLGGDSNNYTNDVHDRLLDPVQRHVGIIATGAGTYDQQGTQDLGRGLQYDDVYFMEPDDDVNDTLMAGVGDTNEADSNDSTLGTYGNPAHLNQSTLDAINIQSPDGARIYLQGGSNANYYVNSTTATEEDLDGNSDLGLYLYNGQDIYGRSANYTAPAASSEQPNIIVDEDDYNGFVVNEGENTFSDLTFTGAGSGTTTSGITIYNSIFNDTDATATIINSNFTEFDVRSLWVINGSTHNAVIVNMNSSTMTNNAGNGVEATNASNSGSLTINATNSTFSSNVNNGIYARNDSANGAFVINTTDSLFNNNGNSGIEANNATSGNAVFTINAVNSKFNANFNDLGGGSGISATQSGANGAFILNATDSQFNNNRDGAGIGAINSGANSTFAVDITGSQINNVVSGYGFAAQNNSTNDMTISITNSQVNNNLVGLYLLNTSSGTLSITDLAGTTFSEDATGIQANNSGSGTVNINWTGASFSNNSVDREQNNSGGGQINWTPNF